MLQRLFFGFLSPVKQVAYLQENGISLGTRFKNGRKVFMYMLKDFCAEVTFTHDNDNLPPEKINVFKNVKLFNAYLEDEFKASY